MFLRDQKQVKQAKLEVKQAKKQAKQAEQTALLGQATVLYKTIFHFRNLLTRLSANSNNKDEKIFLQSLNNSDLFHLEFRCAGAIDTLRKDCYTATIKKETDILDKILMIFYYEYMSDFNSRYNKDAQGIYTYNNKNAVGDTPSLNDEVLFPESLSDSSLSSDDDSINTINRPSSRP